MEGEAATGKGGAHVAAASELPRGTGAVGYQHHDWLEGRSRESIKLIAMIDDATSELFAQFVIEDSTVEHMRVLRTYLERSGRPLAFYTDKAGLFVSSEPAAQGVRRRKDRRGRKPDRPSVTGARHRVDPRALTASQGLRFILHLLRTVEDILMKRRRLASFTPWAWRGGSGFAGVKPEVFILPGTGSFSPENSDLPQRPGTGLSKR